MNRALAIGLVGLIIAPALAGPDVLPVTGTRWATYKFATGELVPTPGPPRYGNPLWAAETWIGWYTGMCGQHHWALLDWGDIPNPIEERTVAAFGFYYSTDLFPPHRIDVIMTFYTEENGWNCCKTFLAGFLLTGLPTCGGTWSGWLVTVDLEGSGYQFLIDGSDLDPEIFPGVDFGYAYWFTPETVPLGSATGPVISGEPNHPDGPGQEDALDAYDGWDCSNANYRGTWWFGGYPEHPFAQLYMKLWNDVNFPQPCPSHGDSGYHCSADIDGTDDCIVGLADLAVLLSKYGTMSGMTHYDGDIEPHPYGDGDVDLADLACLLTQYGDDCN